MHTPVPGRDLIGYGANPPDPRWPGGERIAVNFVMNYEEGSEPSVLDADGYTETGQTELGTLSAGIRGRDLAAEGMFAYGSRVGFWRLMRIFGERRLPLTINGCALALERNPEAARAIRESGHDVCCHGWRWVRPATLTRDQEREHVRKAIASLTQSVGARPLGWCCRYGPSVHTRNLLVEEGGFLYDSDAYDDELPYWVRVGDRAHLVVPYTQVNNDTKFAGGVFGSGTDYFEFHRDAFDVLYAEGKSRPTMMSVGLHMRVIGHPARAAGLQRFLDHLARFPGVWVARRIDIARHWISVHPAAETAS